MELVDWLLGHVTHLPSDIECQRALVAPMPPDTDLLPSRSKSFEMIMKVGDYLFMCLCVSVCLSIGLSVCLSASVPISVCMSVSQSICAYRYVDLSVSSLLVCLSVCVSVSSLLDCLSVCL